MNPPITWARFIMLAEAAGIKADDEVSRIHWTESDTYITCYRDDDSGKVELF